MEPVSLAPDAADRAPSPDLPAPSGTPTPRRRAATARAVLIGVIAVAALVLLLPRPNAVVQPGADVTAAARSAREGLGFAPSVPQGLPDGWTPLLAEVQHDTDGALTWHVGYLAPDGGYLGFVQAASPPITWENQQVVSGPEAGTIEVGANSWLIRDRVDRQMVSYVLRGGPMETIVSGHASKADVIRLIESLRLPPGGA